MMRAPKSKFSRRLAALLAAVTAFVVLLPTSFAVDKPDLNKFPESNVILAYGDDPTTSLNGLEKNADEKAYPASITKVLTALVALEQGNMEDLVTISDYAVKLSSANAKIGVKEGEVYRLLDLMYGMLLPSGCDAAKAVAEQVGGSEEGFAALMNEKARELGSALTITDPAFVEDIPGAMELDFPENVALALAVCQGLGVDRPTAFEGIRHFVRDPFALSVFSGKNLTFVNALSANDVSSTQMIYEKTRGPAAEELVILINNRGDRPARARDMLSASISVEAQEADATSLLGPLLVMNPPFTQYLLDLLGDGHTLWEKDTAMEAYNNRILAVSAL